MCEDGVEKGTGGAGKTVRAIRRLGATGAVVFALRVVGSRGSCLWIRLSVALLYRLGKH